MATGMECLIRTPMTWGSASDGLVCASARLVLPSENGRDDELVGLDAAYDGNVVGGRIGVGVVHVTLKKEAYRIRLSNVIDLSSDTIVDVSRDICQLIEVEHYFS
jgi:hypothetical protein